MHGCKVIIVYMYLHYGILIVQHLASQCVVGDVEYGAVLSEAYPVVNDETNIHR